jgi:two-component system alkaline phosphatase synthesis response regulator PhoP
MVETKKILVVDDDKVFLRLVEYDLSKNGFDVITAPDGEMGILLAKTQKPDLILLDINMPDIEGGDVVTILEANPQTQDIPIIFVTALLTKQEEIRRQNIMGKHSFFSKPYKLERLLEEIDKFI